jgi:hypothetical protein
MGATATERFSRREFIRLIDITDKQLNYWEKLGNPQVGDPATEPQAFGGERPYPRRSSFNFMLARRLAARRASRKLVQSSYLVSTIAT